ncbi:MAG: helix-turn-helix transcriptional regulator [Oscillospiraceae bacterium]|nr:helix-turn-helix transcriptional regulator [Oscillospiraceae bacterium]
MFPKYEYRNTSINVYVWDRLATYPARFHKHLEALLVKSATAKVTIDGKPYTLYPGDVYVAFPNVLHSLERSDSQVIVVIADFELYQAFHDILVHTAPDPPVLRKGTFPQEVYAIFERMGQLYHSELPHKQSVLAGYANALLGELMGSMHLCKRNVGDGLLQQLIFYFLQNYTRDLTLEDVARELNYSKYYISRVVSNTFGCNFRTLINTYRVSMAQNLLVSSAKSISEIALECGFQNQSSFNRIFLKHSDITPGEYRRKMGPPPEKPILHTR